MIEKARSPGPTIKPQRGGFLTLAEELPERQLESREFQDLTGAPRCAEQRPDLRIPAGERSIAPHRDDHGHFRGVSQLQHGEAGGQAD